MAAFPVTQRRLSAVTPPPLSPTTVTEHAASLQAIARLATLDATLQGTSGQAGKAVNIALLEKAATAASPYTKPALLAQIQELFHTRVTEATKEAAQAADAARANPGKMLFTVRQEKAEKWVCDLQKTQQSLEQYCHANLTDDPASLERLLRDVRSIETASPLVRASGMQGPTLLGKNPRGVVLKAAEEVEADSHRLYQAATPNTPDTSLRLPRATFFSEGAMDTSHGKTSLTPRTAESIQNSWEQILAQVKARSETPLVARMERVDGIPFHRFVVDNFKDLSAANQKRIFQDLGRLVVMDFAFGHRDRSVPLEEGCPTNLSNLLVETATGALVPIDNGVAVFTPEELSKDCSRVTEIFADPQGLPNLARTFLDAAVEDLQDEGGPGAATFFKETLEEDLTRPNSHMLSGMRLATQDLRTFALRWESSDLRERLTPAFSQMMTQRLEAFLRGAGSAPVASATAAAAGPMSREDIFSPFGASETHTQGASPTPYRPNTGTPISAASPWHSSFSRRPTASRGAAETPT